MLNSRRKWNWKNKCEGLNYQSPFLQRLASGQVLRARLLADEQWLALKAQQKGLDGSQAPLFVQITLILAKVESV